jgi:hypothetical protein
MRPITREETDRIVSALYLRDRDGIILEESKKVDWSYRCISSRDLDGEKLASLTCPSEGLG